MMKSYIVILSIFLCEFLQAQQITYWVQFTDKNNSPYSLSSPSAYLSTRALTRRANQGIAIDSADLPVNPAYLNGVTATGAVVHSHSKWLNGCVVLLTNPSQLTAIQALPYVQSVSGAGARHANPDAQTKFDEELQTFEITNSQRYSAPQTSSLNYGMSFNQINMLGGVCLHDAGFRGQGMQIAVIDAGFYAANTLDVFDSLWAHNQILGTWDFVAGDSSVFEDNVHGSMVLSTMGGYIPGQLIGTAPDAGFWLLRSEEAATEYLVEEYYWAAAAEFADSVGADVINSSLGYNQFDDPTENHTYADLDGHTVPCARAVNFAARKGMAVVVSAGNSGQSSWFYIGTPADADSALTIAATDASGVVTGFSSRGSLTLFGHQKPSTGAQGQNAIIVDPNGNNITAGSGTSFSSPITCGLVTCLWQAHPSLTCMQLLQTIEQNASQSVSPDSLLGYGIPDFCTANLYLAAQEGTNDPSMMSMTVSPNPFSNSLQLKINSRTASSVILRIYDVHGRIVHEQDMELTRGANNCVLDPGSLSSGIYFVVMNSGSQEIAVKVIHE